MKEIIKITERNGKKAVSARELYSFLEYDNSQFGRYVSSKIINNDFAIEGIDYQQFDIRVDTFNGAQRQIHDYALSIDFAKKLSMLAKTSKGEEIRNYFIECEKQLQKQTISIPQTFAEALQLAADQAKQLELQAPKVESYDKFIDSSALQGFKEVANLLGLGRNTLMKKLRELKIITKGNIPYQQYLNMGLFEVKESTQNGFSLATTYVTPKGIEYIKSKL